MVGGEEEGASHPGGGGHLDRPGGQPWGFLRGQVAGGYFLGAELERGRRRVEGLGGGGKMRARGVGLEIIWTVRRARA